MHCQARTSSSLASFWPLQAQPRQARATSWQEFTRGAADSDAPTRTKYQPRSRHMGYREVTARVTVKALREGILPPYYVQCLSVYTPEPCHQCRWPLQMTADRDPSLRAGTSPRQFGSSESAQSAERTGDFKATRSRNSRRICPSDCTHTELTLPLVCPICLPAAGRFPCGWSECVRAPVACARACHRGTGGGEGNLVLAKCAKRARRGCTIATRRLQGTSQRTDKTAIARSVQSTEVRLCAWPRGCTLRDCAMRR